MSFGIPDMSAVIKQITASAEATDRLATAIDRLAAATEQANKNAAVAS
jgi:hypothetical protein